MVRSDDGRQQEGMDMEAIARRILELAELSVQEHLATLARSQAEGLMELAGESTPRELRPATPMWR